MAPRTTSPTVADPSEQHHGPTGFGDRDGRFARCRAVSDGRMELSGKVDSFAAASSSVVERGDSAVVGTGALVVGGEGQ